MKLSMSPEEFFEAALVAVGPPSPRAKSHEEILRDPVLPEYVALRHEVLGIKRIALQSPEGAGYYSYGSYRNWWNRKQEDLCNPQTGS